MYVYIYIYTYILYIYVYTCDTYLSIYIYIGKKTMLRTTYPLHVAATKAGSSGGATCLTVLV